MTDVCHNLSLYHFKVHGLQSATGMLYLHILVSYYLNQSLRHVQVKDEAPAHIFEASVENL